MAASVAATTGWRRVPRTEGAPPTAVAGAPARPESPARRRPARTRPAGRGGRPRRPARTNPRCATWSSPPCSVLVDPRRHRRRPPPDRLALADRRALDLAALCVQGPDLARRRTTTVRCGRSLWCLADALPGEHAEQAGLADALDDPGDPGRLLHRRLPSESGGSAANCGVAPQARPAAVGTRGRRGTHLAARHRVHVTPRHGRPRPGLDAFSDVVSDFAAASPSATLPSLLDYLYTGRTRGRRPGTRRGRGLRGPRPDSGPSTPPRAWSGTSSPCPTWSATSSPAARSPRAGSSP